MANEKPPAFQWYPRDYLTDENVELMSLEQEGAYRRLMDYCWLHGSIPNDVEAWAKMCRVTPRRMEKLWPGIDPCFRKRNGRLFHPRLDKERRKQIRRKRAQSDAGKKGAERRWQKDKDGVATDPPMGSNGSASSSATASAE